METGTLYDYIILGGGPAGLQLGYYFQQHNHSYLILERGSGAGEFFKTFPRHRKLISINKRFTGYDDPEIQLRWDWNSLLCEDSAFRFTHYSKEYFPDADGLITYLEDYARRFQLRLQSGVCIEKIHKNGHFILHDTHGKEYHGKRLIVATGVSQPYIPKDIPGIETVDCYTSVSLDAEEFANQRVLIIGKGNSAFETADHLIATAATLHLVSPHSVTMAWQSHFVGNLRAVNNNLLDTYQLKSQNAVLDADILRIQKTDTGFAVTVAYKHANDEVETLEYDRVIACTGFRFDASIFDESCRPELAVMGRFPAQTNAWESVNVPDLYFGGTLMQERDYRKTTSGFIHGFRYNVRCLFHILQTRYHGQSWPSTALALDPDALTHAIIERINTSSALWQQFGFIGDIVVLNHETQSARYIEEVPSMYASDFNVNGATDYFMVTLDYGEGHQFQDPFTAERIERTDIQQASESKFLHPIVRHYHDGAMVSEHHVIEDLKAEWREEEHVKPLLKYLVGELTRKPAYSMATDCV